MFSAHCFEVHLPPQVLTQKTHQFALLARFSIVVCVCILNLKFHWKWISLFSYQKTISFLWDLVEYHKAFMNIINLFYIIIEMVEGKDQEHYVFGIIVQVWERP